MKRILALLLLTSFAQAQTVVRTEGGLVSGTGAAPVVFKGIPFAAPPTGDRRWRPPQPVQLWDGVRKADRFSASPMQSAPVPFSAYTMEFLIPPDPIGEDCLYLNVWTSDVRSRKPVLVWIYGGGFTSGSGSVPIYDGTELAKRGIVVVTINYRVGVFGFLAHPELTAEEGSSGNYGMLDQLAALQWVQRNIAAFGGDPARVTIAGQSAGSFSVSTLMASPLAKGLFRQAIGESGSLFRPAPEYLLANAEKEGQAYVASLGVSSVKALRQLPADQLLKKYRGRPRPVIDGEVLPADLPAIFSQGRQNDVTLLTGWTEGDGSLAWLSKVKTADEYQAYARTRYGAKAPAFLAVFPGNTDPEAKQSQARIFRDTLFASQDYTWAKLQVKTGSQPVYVYSFGHVPAGSPEQEELGAFHTSEVPYAFHNLNRWNRPWTPKDRQMEEMMSAYWVNFVKTGNPNGKGLPVWPAFQTGKEEVLDIGKDVRHGPAKIKNELELLDSLKK
ncbi:carboxylesterase/lipase family protein [Siphonobacter aquaeclarae]|uniref:Carboxylic ester hydrolase n=1 Tax=Siphonobacter aquaeclarae TaxID=563176 RepID=A0A1G9L353_9BACT|nr:carboxylesterase family protein [Siphonobacter aquaeclarae]SDL56226.1 para-nitrobenzyl esterase [Siphonobacter aquaeclarae]